MKKLLISLLSFGFFAHIYAAEMKLVYWSHTHDPAVGVNEKIINDFMNENPNIEVVYDHVPHANYEQKIMTAFAGKEGPDLFWAGDWMVPQYIENKMIAPVDPSAFGVSSQVASFPSVGRGLTSQDSDTGMPGKRASSIAPSSRSCAGLM